MSPAEERYDRSCNNLLYIQSGLKFAARGACVAAVYTAIAPVGIMATVGTVALGLLSGQLLCGNSKSRSIRDARLMGYTAIGALYGIEKGYRVGGVLGAAGGSFIGFVGGMVAGVILGVDCRK